ncbi:TetR/AcrR family transcriptional regulator [Actinocorallia sp. A-T 12471]|uniref:TetR/AcrR family transcriptional regulator n=1 Tax=Actinocorallia sp. A-T 12471 TaxID=3089813 RepID=UPI0029CDBB16|nr:TetR/AcrR family transcriptional regulator [Actinocorallia sp. A-T 12471]MDX6742743.1 TetR/AcrR family transcriptional regulator [Actinocorallia sp. A-T 12471]
MPAAADRNTALGRAKQADAAMDVHYPDAPLDVQYLAGSASAPARRQDGREVKLGPRGAATRLRLMEAARVLFEKNGYGRVSVAHICERAKVSQGTYYQYFRDRGDIMLALVDAYVVSLLQNSELVWHVEEGREGLARLLDSYVGDYAENAAFARVWEEVSQIEPPLADARRRLTRVIEGTMARQLAKGVALGHIPPISDVSSTARALAAMADRHCYLTYAFDPPATPIPPAQTAALLTTLWSQALNLP